MLSFGSKVYPKELKAQSVQAFWARLASSGHLGLISGPLIVPKYNKGIHDPNRQVNSIIL